MKSVSLVKRIAAAAIAMSVAAAPFELSASALEVSPRGDTQNAGISEDCTKYVNTFVGTDVDGGQLFPGAITPSGLVKLSPDTYPHNDNDHAGYDYSKTSISGFSHTRVEGVGGDGAGGDILVTPTYIDTVNEPSDGAKAQNFLHSEEKAEPGYYETMLTPKTGTGTTNTTIGKIKAELTTNNNVGMHRYTFPKAGDASLVLDLGYGYNKRNGRNSTMTVKTDGRNTFLQGSIQARTVGNKTTYQLYYYAETSIPAKSVKTWGISGGKLDDSTARSGADIGAVLRFDVSDSSSVVLKVALSTISEEQARRDMSARIDGWYLDSVRLDAKSQWAQLLGRISINTANRDELEQKYDEVYESFYKQGGNQPDSNTYSAGGSMQAQAEISEAEEDARLKTLFYTHLYHMFTTPVNATSSDNTYRVNSELVKHADDFTYYDSWSLWDDFRKYPVLGLVAPDIYKNQIESIANLAEYGVGNLYNNSLSTNTVPTVRAEHAVSLLADGVAKGLTGIDNLRTAYNRFKTLSNGYWGSANLNRGYFSGNVGNTVEYSYDDWAISLIGRHLGESEDVEAYSKRALNYRNLFRKNALTKSYVKDGKTITDNISILWPKEDNGTWRDSNASATDMNNKAAQYEYSGYQGTLWQYSLWDSYDASGLMKLMGDSDEAKGKQNLLTYMKYLYGMNVSDGASGNELQNAVLHSNTNEIDLQTPYMFNVAGKPSLTQYWTRQIYTKCTFNSYSGTGRNNTDETRKQKPVYAYKLDPYGFMETMDDDCGTMAGNFVAAAMGLYPMTPGDTTYQMTSPFFEEMTIDLGNGKTFTIKADGVSSKNFYIQSAKLNGETLDRSWIDYSEIARGGVLEFTMGDKPSQWAENGQSVPSVDELDGQTVSDYLAEPALEYSKTTVNEAAANDGTISDDVLITAKNGALFAGEKNEDFTDSKKVKIDNLPEGLAVEVVKVSDNSLRLSFSGTAVSHDSDVNDLSIAFSDSAFNGLTANKIVDSYKANLNALVLDFKTDLKAKLQDYVDSVKNVSSGIYTAATFGKFSTALTNANNTLAAAQSDDASYQNAYDKLYSAFIQLKIKASAFDSLLASQADKYSACSAGAYVVNSKDGSFVSYNARNFGNNGVAAVTIRYDKASAAATEDSHLELRKGGADGELIRTINLAYTGQKWEGTGVKYTVYFSDPGILTGIQDLYVVFKSSDPKKLVCRLFELEFTEAGSYRRTEAENVSSWSDGTNPYNSDVLKVENGGTGKNVGGTFDGAWLAYSGINFNGGGLKAVSVNYSNNLMRCGANARAEFRLDSPDGELFATVPLPATDGTWNKYKTTTAEATKQVTGKHTLYVVLHADTNSSTPFVSNIDYFEFTGNVNKTALKSKIKDAASYKPDKYTAASLKNLLEKAAAAQSVFDDESATQEAADAAAGELSEAVRALVRCTSRIALSQTGLSMNIGELKKLTAAAYVDDALSTDPVNNSFAFTSSNTKAATVTADGIIKAVGAGTAVITVKSTDGSPVRAICTVKVLSRTVTAVKLNFSKAKLTVKGKKQLKATVYPGDAADKKVTWKSSNSKKASVSASGKITAKAPGRVTITATASGKTAKCTVTVNPAGVSRLKLAKKGRKLSVKFKKGAGSRYTRLVIYRNNKKYKTISSVSGASYKLKVKKGTYRVKAEAFAKVSGKAYKGAVRTSNRVKVK